MAKSGLLFILSAPSGAGKSTLAKSIVKKDKRFVLSVSYTTRLPRPYEVDGKDYHFVSENKFEKLREAGTFIETARVHGAYYGTPKKYIERMLSRGQYVLLAIDVVGAENIVKAHSKNTVSVFLLPPNAKVWIGRLKQRKESAWKTRVKNAKKEMQAINFFNYKIINDNLKDATADFFAIVRAEELKKQKPSLSRLN